YKNINIPSAESDWGCHVSYYAKDVLFENCTLNRIDIHFYGMDYKSINSKIIGRAINYQCFGYLHVENTEVHNSDCFLSGRYDYVSWIDGSIILKDIKLLTSSMDASLISFQHDHRFDYIIQTKMAERIIIENAEIVSLTANEDAFFHPIRFRTSQGYTGDILNKKRIVMPSEIILKNLSVSGRVNGYQMRFYNLHDLMCRKENEYDSENEKLMTNSLIIIDKMEGRAADYTPSNLSTYNSFLHFSANSELYDDYSYMPKILINNCNHITINTDNTLADIQVSNSVVRSFDGVVSGVNNIIYKGLASFDNCTFSPYLLYSDRELRTNYFRGELGIYFSNCRFDVIRIFNELTGEESIKVPSVTQLGLKEDKLYFNNNRLDKRIPATPEEQESLLLHSV